MSKKADQSEADTPINNTEHKVTDTTGKFTMAAQGGQQVDEISWLEGRIILSNQSLYLIGNSGRLSIDFTEITGLSGQEGSTQTFASLSEYFRVECGEDVVIVSPDNYEKFRERVYTATLDGETIKCKHPTVSGGVVQDVSWETARLSVRDEQLVVTLNNGTQVTLGLNEISKSAPKRRTIRETERRVICVSHIEGDSTVETELTAPNRICMFVQSFLAQGEQRSITDIDLTKLEQEVLLALHTGVKPFDIPEFIGTDIETVEDTFDRLVAHGIIDRVRMRQEVKLNSSGRNIVSDTLSE